MWEGAQIDPVGVKFDLRSSGVWFEGGGWGGKKVFFKEGGCWSDVCDEGCFLGDWGFDWGCDSGCNWASDWS